MSFWKKWLSVHLIMLAKSIVEIIGTLPLSDDKTSELYNPSIHTLCCKESKFYVPILSISAKEKKNFFFA